MNSKKKQRITSAGGAGTKDQSLIQRILTNLCHSLAINEEMSFDADLRRFSNIMEDLQGAAQSANKHAQDPGLEQGIKGLREFSSMSFKKLYRGDPSDQLRDLMQYAFGRCVKT